MRDTAYRLSVRNTIIEGSAFHREADLFGLQRLGLLGLVLVEALTGGDDPEIEGGSDALNDPWGNPLHYERVGKGGRFKITSDGPDMEPGTDDDLTNIADKK